MAACAETLTPVLLECGGKDAMIVDADADLDAAASAAAWGGLTNAGQTCIGIERVYVVDAVHDAFVAKLVDEGDGTLKVGGDADSRHRPDHDAGADRHDPAAHRRRARHAAAGRCSAARTRSQAPYVQPTILVDVPEDSAAVPRRRSARR